METKNKIDSIILRLEKTKEDFETGESVTNEEIEKIEKDLNIELPSDYKYFLGKYGYAFWSGAGILGVCNDPDDEEYFSMPYFTMDDRGKIFPEYFMPRPKNTVVVGPYGGGGHFFLHCMNSDRGGKVELLLTELNGRPDVKSWDSFTEFLGHYK